MFEPIQPAAHIKLDLFPARVTTVPTIDPQTREISGDPHVFGDELRVIVTDSHFYVLAEGGKGPEAIIALPLTHFEGKTATGYTVDTQEGLVYHVIRAANCGCGARLRGFHPFPGVPYTRS